MNRRSIFKGFIAGIGLAIAKSYSPSSISKTEALWRLRPEFTLDQEYTAWFDMSGWRVVVTDADGCVWRAPMKFLPSELAGQIGKTLVMSEMDWKYLGHKTDPYVYDYSESEPNWTYPEFNRNRAEET